MIDPSLLFVRCEPTVIALRTGFDEIAVVASGDDPFSIGVAVENRAGMYNDAPLATFTGESQRLFAEHEYRRRSQKMHADNRRAGVHGSDAISKRRNRDLRVAHVRRCSFRSLDEFCLPEDCAR